MRQATGILSVLVAADMLPSVLAGATLDPPSAIPTRSSSASLYGSEDLLGEVAQPVPVSGGDSAEGSAAELVNGQEAPQDLGLYLDFNSVDVPQPIRGDGGGTANSPSAYSSSPRYPVTW